MVGRAGSRGTDRVLRVVGAGMSEKCIWRENEDGYYETGCDNAFIIESGTPEDNHMAFCCYCGKPLESQNYEWDEE